MKTVYKFLMSGAMALALTGAAATTSFAQDDPAQEAKIALYTKFTDCYAKRKTASAAELDSCYAVAKEYVDKYGSETDQYITFVKKAYTTYTTSKASTDRINRFNDAVKDPKAINMEAAVASGKELTTDPDAVDVPIVLASIGYDKASAQTPDDKYNADTIMFAKMAIDRINAGKVSPSGQYGAYNYVYKTQKYPDGKNNALGWMNYYIGYIMYNRMKQPKEALPYLYKATQVNSETKNTAEVYRLIGNWYADEFARIDKDRIAKVQAANGEDTDETKALFALQKGYAERAADAYARGYKVVSPTATQAYKDALLTRSKQLYGIRFNNDPAKVDGYDAFATAAIAKPFVDPTTAVTPVEIPAETTPTTGTPTTGTAPTTTPSTGTPKPTTAPTTTTTKPSTTTTPTTTTKPSTTTTPSTTTKPVAKPTPTKPSAKTSTTTTKKNSR